MPRRNTPASRQTWALLEAGAPHRATIRNDMWWPLGRPGPEIVTCSRILPGGRMLCAFQSEAARDTFVSKFADMGARKGDR
jgi:hypothetical protein